ncbi:MAG: hypothetical protein V1655_01685 [bacterium]
MIPIQTTKDILFLVIAFCVLLLTIFLAWLLYYFIAIIRDVRKLTKSIEDKVEKTGAVIDLIKNKVDSSATHFILLVEAIKQIVKFAMERREAKKAAKKKK